MNSRTWLVLDISNLAHRAFHTTGELEYGGDGTGVLFGIFRDILSLIELHGTRDIVFCFDGGYRQRKIIYPGYKQNRKSSFSEMDDDEIVARNSLRRQIRRLRDKYLPRIGFQNILWEEDYEADDLIAKVCDDSFADEMMVVVSSDQDLWQLIAPNVICWNPITKKSITKESFEKEWGISPSMWSHIKAIAGCKSDDVPGVKGVGEKTAAKFLTGKLKESTKAYQAIIGSNKRIDCNLELTRLPMPGLPEYELADDSVSRKKWDEVMSELGMKSLVGGIR